MMPSRGLHIARGHAPRLYQLQCRNLSSASRRIPQPAVRRGISAPLRSSQWHKISSASPYTLPSIRHASSTPEAAGQAASSTGSPHEAASAAISPANPVAEPASFSSWDTANLDTVRIDDIIPDIAKIPEGIGYLKEIGIDYGYGITSGLQWVIEHIHIVGGLPWWGSIAATAVLMRLSLFPLFLKSSDSMARAAALGSVLKPVMDKAREAQARGDSASMQMYTQEYYAIRRRAGVKTFDQLSPMILQGILGFCGFRLIRAMCVLPVPAFVTEGPLWLADLSLSDPFLLLPLFMAGSMHLLGRMGGESAAQTTMPPGMKKVMLYGLPGLIFVIMGWQPAALCIWFTATGTVGISQALLLQRPAVRNYFGLAPLYKPAEHEKDEGLMALLRKSPSEEKKDAANKAGKNEAFMNPTYQSPNLRRKRTFRRPGDDLVIDTTATTRTGATAQATPAAASGPEMVQPNPAKESILQQASTAWSSIKQMTKEREVKNKAEREANAVKTDAENYEKRFQARRKRGSGR